jgi:hypothetical protein
MPTIEYQQVEGGKPAGLVHKGKHKEVVFKVACKNLPKGDWFSKSDPICVLEVQDPGSGKYEYVQQTVGILQNLHPR